MRIGQGYDLHRLEAGVPLILGGVTIPFEKGLAGHSDGDALAHAVTDALFGAIALGNIGTHFPDTEDEYQGADSIKLLEQAAAQVRDADFRIVNVDATIVAEAPKLNPYVDAMRQNLAWAMGIDLDLVSVKPKTNEGVGPEGRGEAISTQAIVLLQSVR